MVCKICSRTCDKLKNLTCGHQYCQGCVDGILQVNIDDNGKLQCPLGCTEKTAIKTTSSPRVSLTDELKEKNEETGKAIQCEIEIECKNCLRTCDQLKSLNCGHQYCKDYVNGNVDDDGEFQCSLGCTEKIAVEKHDTTPSPTASLTDDFKEKNKITGATIESECKLECKTCLRTFDQIKSLNCGHQYCKDCVNGNVDDNGEFQCPLGCGDKSALEKHDTTSSLTTSLTNDFKEKNENTGDRTIEGTSEDKHKNYTFEEKLKKYLTCAPLFGISKESTLSSSQEGDITKKLKFGKRKLSSASDSDGPSRKKIKIDSTIENEEEEFEETKAVCCARKRSRFKWSSRINLRESRKKKRRRKFKVL